MVTYHASDFKKEFAEQKEALAVIPGYNFYKIFGNIFEKWIGQLAKNSAVTDVQGGAGTAYYPIRQYAKYIAVVGGKIITVEGEFSDRGDDFDGMLNSVIFSGDNNGVDYLMANLKQFIQKEGQKDISDLINELVEVGPKLKTR